MKSLIAELSRAGDSIDVNESNELLKLLTMYLNRGLIRFDLYTKLSKHVKEITTETLK